MSHDHGSCGSGILRLQGIEIQPAGQSGSIDWNRMQSQIHEFVLHGHYDPPEKVTDFQVDAGCFSEIESDRRRVAEWIWIVADFDQASVVVFCTRFFQGAKRPRFRPA